MRFTLRQLLLCTAICTTLFALIVPIVRHYSYKDFVTKKIESLHGGVSVDFPPGAVVFSLGGRTPLVTDNNLHELAPYLASLRVHIVGLCRTEITDEGLVFLLARCQDYLTSLDIADTATTEKSIQLLPKVEHLGVLSLSHQHLTEGSVRALAACKSLRRIYVYDCKSDDQRINALKQAMDGRAAVEARSAKSINGR
jgi:hypothetical protein